MENLALIGLSRHIALHRELEVVANNIANLDTTGYKSDGSVFHEFLMPVARHGSFQGRDQRLSFVHDRATWHNFSVGPTKQTGNPLDVSIDGNAFMVVQTARGERYTRNGAFQINNQGQLVTNDGFPVMGANGPVTFQSGDQDIAIARDGTITVREGNNTNIDSVRGKLRVVSFERPQSLSKQGANLFVAPNGAVANQATNFGVRQGSIEKSNVNGVSEMAKMIEVMRAYTGIANLIQQLNDVRKASIERLADVPA
jgi:flagellar basal-body rod protein FlgF